MLDPSRVYGSYDEMFKKELLLPKSERIDVCGHRDTNNVHY